MKQNVIVINSRQWSKTDPKTGEISNYAMLSWCSSARSTAKGVVGYEVNEGFVDPAVAAQVTTPGLYEAEMEIGSYKGAAQVRIVGLKLISALDLAGK